MPYQYLQRISDRTTGQEAISINSSITIQWVTKLYNYVKIEIITAF